MHEMPNAVDPFVKFDKRAEFYYTIHTKFESKLPYIYKKEKNIMAVKTEKKYVITNRRSGKVLTAVDNRAVQLEANNTDAQIWCAVPTEGTEVKLVNKAAGTALCVDGEAENGTPVVLSENAEGWKLTTTTKGFRKLVHVASGKVVDIKEISDADYAPAQVWDFVKGENQDWILTEVEKEKKPAAKRAAKASK